MSCWWWENDEKFTDLQTARRSQAAVEFEIHQVAGSCWPPVSVVGAYGWELRFCISHYLASLSEGGEKSSFPIIR